MLYFIAAEVVKQSEPQSKLCVLLFGRRDLVNNCEKGHFLFFRGLSKSPCGILLIPYPRNKFMLSYLSYGYQCTYDIGFPKQKLSLEKDITSGHNYWDASSKVFTVLAVCTCKNILRLLYIT